MRGALASQQAVHSLGSRAWRGISNRKWAAFRLTILRRDGYVCAHCAGYGHHVDHIKPLAQGGAAFDATNTQVLCARCHRNKTIIENGYKVDHERDAWRDYLAGQDTLRK